MKKIFKNPVFMFILGIAITSTSVFAYSLFANTIGFEPIDTTWNVENVKEALDDLNNRSLIRDIELDVNDLTSISMNISTKTNYENATYMYLINKELKTSLSNNNYTYEDLEPGTVYNIQVIVYTEDGKMHIGSKRQSTAEAVWLYKDGQTYDLSGGFSMQGTIGSASYTLTNYDTYMRLNVPADKRAVFARENTIIDFSKYKKAYVRYINSNGNPSSVFISTRSNYNGYDTTSGDLGFNFSSSASGRHTVAYDVSELNTNAYIYFRKTHTGYMDIERIWLEE